MGRGTFVVTRNYKNNDPTSLQEILWAENSMDTEAVFEEEHGTWDPMPELAITLPYVHSRVDSPCETLCQSRP